jgi:hypothetical protein
MIVTPEIPERLAEGTFAGTIIKLERMTTRAGREYIRWIVLIEAAEESKYIGRWAFHNTFEDGRALKSHTRFYRAVTENRLGRVPALEKLLGRKISFSLIKGTRRYGIPTGYLDLAWIRPVRTSGRATEEVVSITNAAESECES